MVNLLVGLTRVLIGPSTADRMLAVQLLGTNGVGLLVVIATGYQRYALLDIALILALLASLTLIAFVRFRSTVS
jgi:multicomponent Na+:H+ antiporter subunit F